LLFLRLSLVFSVKKKEEILVLDEHRFRHTVFRRDLMEIWVGLLTSQSYAGHTHAATAFDEAFAIAKGFLKFAYLDSEKNHYLPRRLNATNGPYFCVFHPAGENCFLANVTARELVNRAAHYITDSAEIAEANWVAANEQNPIAILFTDAGFVAGPGGRFSEERAQDRNVEGPYVRAELRSERISDHFATQSVAQSGI
jgi:hypothetical protein